MLIELAYMLSKEEYTDTTYYIDKIKTLTQKYNELNKSECEFVICMG